MLGPLPCSTILLHPKRPKDRLEQLSQYGPAFHVLVNFQSLLVIEFENHANAINGKVVSLKNSNLSDFSPGESNRFVWEILAK